MTARGRPPTGCGRAVRTRRAVLAARTASGAVRPGVETPNSRSPRRRRAGAVQLVAMVVASAGYLVLLVAGVRELRPFPPPVVALLLATLAVAALPGRRWPSAAGACVCAVALFGALVIYRATYDRLADPGQVPLWAGTALQVSGLGVAVVAGILAALAPAPRGRTGP